MVEPTFDKDLELVKLQIAAENCLAQVQINLPLFASTIIVLFVFAFTIMIQYPAGFPPTAVFVSVVTGIMVGLTILIYIALIWTRRAYERGIRELSGYVENNIKAGKPLPHLSTLCGIKEKNE